MDKIVLKKLSKTPTDSSRVLRIKTESYKKVAEISEETGIPVTKLASILIEAALENVVLVDTEEGEE